MPSDSPANLSIALLFDSFVRERRYAMLALAGTLARAAWSETESLVFCDALYRAIDGPDLSQFGRVENEVCSTFEKWGKGESTTGTKSLTEFIDGRIVSRALEWLHLPGESSYFSADDGRPTVELKNRNLDEKVEECVCVLKGANNPPDLYFRRGTLVRLVREDNGRFSIRDVSEGDLSLHLSKKITFLKGGNKTNPCERTTRGVLAELSPCEEIPSLEGIVSAPVIRADGTILDQPGYDRASKLFYAPARGLVVPPISPEPTEDEIAKARAVIDDAIGDFPFKDESSKANAIAAIITPIVRPVNRRTPQRA